MRPPWILTTIITVVLTCEDHHHHRHPGETEHALVHPVDPILLLGRSASSSASNVRRSLLSNPLEGRCGTPNPSREAVHKSIKVLERWEALKNHKNKRNVATNLTIAVWWHVMKAGDTKAQGAWSTRLVKLAIAKANKHFKNSPFVFRLAGVTQTRNANWFNCGYDDDYATEYEYKTSLRVEGAATLNVYMCDLLTSQGLFGYAYQPTILEEYPEYDGITLANPFPSSKTALDAHMTFVHEIGHWLGLYHSWTGKCGSTSGGDSVHDTPAHLHDTWHYKGWDTCFEGITYNSCDDNVPGVDPGRDPLLNHMNYVHSPCQDAKGHFT